MTPTAFPIFAVLPLSLAFLFFCLASKSRHALCRFLGANSFGEIGMPSRIPAGQAAGQTLVMQADGEQLAFVY